MYALRHLLDLSHLRVVKVPRPLKGPILDSAGKKVIGVFFVAYGVTFLFHKATKAHPYEYTVIPMLYTVDEDDDEEY